METRKFGNTGLTPSILGFGMMRMKKNEKGEFDEKWTVDTLRYAIYLDFLFANSQKFVNTVVQLYRYVLVLTPHAHHLSH